MPSIDLGHHTIGYSVVKGNSRRYTYFRFRPDLTLEVILPRGRAVDVDSLLRSRISWVRREYERLSSTKSVLSTESLMLGGERLAIVFSPGSPERIEVDLEAKQATVFGAERRGVAELVRRLFLKETSAYVVRRVREVAPSMGVRPTKVDVREIGKWGYCTRTGRISFSWQLASLPESLKDYVIFHELAHLKHFDHSRRFRAFLQAACPDFRRLERELDRVVPYDRLRPPS